MQYILSSANTITLLLVEKPSSSHQSMIMFLFPPNYNFQCQEKILILLPLCFSLEPFSRNQMQCHPIVSEVASLVDLQHYCGVITLIKTGFHRKHTEISQTPDIRPRNKSLKRVAGPTLHTPWSRLINSTGAH